MSSCFGCNLVKLQLAAFLQLARLVFQAQLEHPQDPLLEQQVPLERHQDLELVQLLGLVLALRPRLLLDLLLVVLLEFRPLLVPCLFY